MQERTIIGAFVGSMLIFAVIGMLGYSHLGKYSDQRSLVEHTLHVLRSLHQTLGELQDVETGQRGYLVSGDEMFLEPYHDSLERITERLAELRRLTAEDPAQQRRLDNLEPVIDEKLVFTAETVEAFRGGEEERARALVATGRGKDLMDTIRRRVDAMQEAERERLDRRAQEAEALSWRTTTLILFGNAFAFALLASATLVLGRAFDRQRQMQHNQEVATEQARLKGEVGRARLGLQAMIEEMPQGVVLAEPPAGVIVLANARMRTLRGVTAPEDTDDPPIIELLEADGSSMPTTRHPIARALRDGAIVRGEAARLRRADGTVVDVVTTAAPVREAGGHIVAAVATFQPRSEVLHAQEVQRRSEDFRDVFLSALGHDLRNPLTVITAGATSLARRVPGDENAMIVARMLSSAERMNRMVGQLIELTRARLGQGVAIEREWTDLGSIVRRVVERREVLHPDRVIEVSEEGELAGRWDPQELGRAVDELVLNAIQHGLKGGAIRVSVHSAGDEARVEVHNRGSPIPEELKPLMFDPFRRAAERKRAKSFGLGLGLYLADQIVRAHGGRIDVLSEEDLGTCFRIVLPRDHG